MVEEDKSKYFAADSNNIDSTFLLSYFLHSFHSRKICQFHARTLSMEITKTSSLITNFLISPFTELEAKTNQSKSISIADETFPNSLIVLFTFHEICDCKILA
jgi:hypothetical protein